MGSHLGIKTPDYDPYKGMTQLDIDLTKNEEVYPEKPLIAQEDWDKIVAYYQKNAPENLIQNREEKNIGALKGFNIKKPILPDVMPLISLSKIENGKIYIGLLDGRILVLDNNLQKTASYSIDTPPVAVHVSANSFIDVIGVGEIRPNQRDEGAFFQVNPQRPERFMFGALRYLRRPVDFIEIDLNNDQQNEVIVCEYGYLTGQLAWYEFKNKQWLRHILSDKLGATKIIAEDFNKDGLTDFGVLFAQGDEHISIFYNKENGDFEEKTVLRFPPIYGSSHIQFVDFNYDGHKDILYTNGDNEDFSPVLKPYHGVRVFINDGKDNFSQKWFQPFYGAFQSVAADFDLDGDIDIATISFFPDNQQKAASNFKYFEQTSPFVFQTSTFDEAIYGNWMTIDAGDIDLDGDSDILLGSFALNKKPQDRGKREYPFVILQNKKK